MIRSRALALSESIATALAVAATLLGCVTDAAGGRADMVPAGANSPPRLAPVGDRLGPIGVPIDVALRATDPDGDSLEFGALVPGTDAEVSLDPATGQFIWWPPADGPARQTVTFVVHDADSSDRETVTLRTAPGVGSGGGAPLWRPLSDQLLSPGDELALELEASDPDGDPVFYGHTGSLPNGATVDAEEGWFRWTPTAADAGRVVRVTFTASDGGAPVSEDVALVVSEGGAESSVPPELVGTSTVSAAPPPGDGGLELTLTARDGDGDKLTFRLDAPSLVAAGAELGPPAMDADGVTWRAALRVPGAALGPWATTVGEVLLVPWSVTDGVYERFDVLTVLRVPDGGASCSDDPSEPNDDLAQAPTWQPGGPAIGVLCQASDVDVLRVPEGDGRPAGVRLSAPGGLGHLALEALGEQGQVVASDVSPDADKSLALPVEAVAVQVRAVAFGGVALPFALWPDDAVCAPDDAEPDGDAAVGPEVGETGGASWSESEARTLCPGDVDAVQLAVTCGQVLEAEVLGEPAWWPVDSTVTVVGADGVTPVVAGLGGAVTGAAPAPGARGVLVEAGEVGAGRSYTLRVSATAGCADDPLAPNHEPAQAAELMGGSGALEGLVACCALDWFAVPDVAAGAPVVVRSVPDGGGAVALSVHDATGLATYGEAVAAPGEPAEVAIDAPVAGALRVRVVGSAGTMYRLEWQTDGGEEAP